MKILLILPIRFYRYAISPLMAPHCRFYPTCSAYAEDAIRRHGPLRGSVLAAKRLLRCHPGTPGGYDPVPEIFAWRAPPAGGVIPDATPSSPEANKAS